MVADARHIPVKNATFDAIFAIHVIGHMQKPDRQKIACEVTRALRPGGIVFFCEFSTEDVPLWEGAYNGAFDFYAGDKNYYALFYPAGSCRSFSATSVHIDRPSPVADENSGKQPCTIRSDSSLYQMTAHLCFFYLQFQRRGNVTFFIPHHN